MWSWFEYIWDLYIMRTVSCFPFLFFFNYITQWLLTPFSQSHLSWQGAKATHLEFFFFIWPPEQIICFKRVCTADLLILWLHVHLTHCWIWKFLSTLMTHRSHFHKCELSRQKEWSRKSELSTKINVTMVSWCQVIYRSWVSRTYKYVIVRSISWPAVTPGHTTAA